MCLKIDFCSILTQYYSDTLVPNIGDQGSLIPDKMSSYWWKKFSLKKILATGKSTFIKILEEASETEDWEITPEPVSQWTQIDGEQV